MKETKVFISHRSLDVDYAATVVDFLEDLGVSSNAIVCTSVPGHLIPNGQKIYDWLRSQFTEYNLHMIFLLSDNYYNSPDCLNEMGAAWVTKTGSDVFLLPGFSPDKIRGCIGSDTMAIECEGKYDILADRITLLRNKVCKEFGLSIPNERRWTRIKDGTIKELRGKKSKKKDNPSQPIETDEKAHDRIKGNAVLTYEPYYKEYEAKIGEAIIDKESRCSFIIGDMYSTIRAVDIRINTGDGQSLSLIAHNLGEAIEVGKDHGYSLIPLGFKDMDHCKVVVMKK